MEQGKQYPLSLGQERIWFEEHIEPGTATYNVPYCFRIRGAINVKALERSLHFVVDRHEILRTVFIGQNGQGVQIVGRYQHAMFSFEDCRIISQGDRLDRAVTLAREAARIPFDLNEGPPVRMKLFRLEDRDHILSLTFHHLVCDGWSIGVFFRELAEAYRCVLQGGVPALAPLPIQYGEYAIWQRKELQEGSARKHTEYFQGQLGGTLPPLNLPTDHVRPPIRYSRGSSFFFPLDQPLYARLQGLCAEQKVTRFMLLLAAFKTLLFRYTGQEDLLVGTPVAGRVRPDTFDSIGFFVNTLVLRTSVEGDPTFLELLARIRETTLKAVSHQEFPFEELVRVLKVQRDLSRTPLFQVMFVQNPVDELPRLDRASLERIDVVNGGAKCDLTLYVTRSAEAPRASIEYSTELFEERTIHRIAGHFEQLLRGVASDPGHRLSELPMLTESERRQIVVEWNTTDKEFTRQRCIHELFEGQAERKGKEIALVVGENRTTYEELNRRANQLAHLLKSKGAKPDVLVGLCVERSVEMVVGMLGILKAGGAYLPLDPEFPRERIGYILQDGRVEGVVTESQFAEKVRGKGIQVVCLDTDKDEIESQNKENPSRAMRPENLAYVLYTSGSSGKPKGVAIEHRSTVAFLSWAAEELGSDNLNGVLASTSVSFDLSVLEILLPLCHGGKSIVVRNALHLSSAPAAQEVRLVNTVPTLMKELLRVGGLPPSVKTIILGGERLHPSLVQAILEIGTIERLYNAYGPTETTTYSTCALLSPGGRITIGRPISNTTTYILDRFLNPVPVGVNGELCIGGAGVARGYLHLPGLTGEKFVTDPFSRDPGRRLYKSGDLARYRSDGTIEFLGRLDDQVKIRGYRIELGEIESLLKEHPHVRDAVVDVRPDKSGEKKLVAYVIPNRGATLSTAEAIAYLRKRLPQYMIPSSVVFVDRLPLTSNGKIDRRALPDPESAAPSGEPSFVAPRTLIEQHVAGIFAEVLGVQRVGLHDVFFDLGGHSLSAMRVVLRLAQEIGVEVSLRVLFEHPSVEALAEVIDCARRNRSANQKTI